MADETLEHPDPSSPLHEDSTYVEDPEKPDTDPPMGNAVQQIRGEPGAGAKKSGAAKPAAKTEKAE